MIFESLILGLKTDNIFGLVVFLFKRYIFQDFIEKEVYDKYL